MESMEVYSVIFHSKHFDGAFRRFFTAKHSANKQRFEFEWLKSYNNLLPRRRKKWPTKYLYAILMFSVCGTKNVQKRGEKVIKTFSVKFIGQFTPDRV